MKRIAICMLIAGVMAVATPASAGVIFQQDFSAGGVTGDYIDATATPANTTDFGLMNVAASAGVYAISSNALTLDRTPVGYATNELVRGNMDGGSLLRMVWDMKIVSANYGQNGTGLFVGQATTATDNLGPYVNRFVFLVFTGTGGDGFTMTAQGGSTSAKYTIGSNDQWSLFCNNTASSESYTAPDASTSSVAARSYDLWIGNTVFFDDEARYSTFPDVSVLSGFKLGQSKNDDALWTFDNFEIRNDLIPEPATIGLLVMGGLGMLLKRCRA